MKMDTIANMAKGSSSVHKSSSSSAKPPSDLDQQFEAEFSKHLEEVNKKSRLRSVALGAGLGGALSFMAAPAVVPSLALAALTGAGGYQWARKRGEEQLKRHGACAGGPAMVASQRPSLRRLRFLVEWGHWQLHEYESASVDCRAAVLSEVVCAFSPWVQRIFLLPKGSGESNMDARETAQHLAPLYHWLQRRATFDSTIQAAEHAGAAGLLGPLDQEVIERCRITFPAMLETIAFVDRMGPTAREEPVAPTSPKHMKRRRRRLGKIVAALRQVIERPDIVEAIRQGPRRSASASTLRGGVDAAKGSNGEGVARSSAADAADDAAASPAVPSGRSAPTLSTPEDATDSSFSPSSPSGTRKSPASRRVSSLGFFPESRKGVATLVVPPEGVENEEGAMGLDDEEYFSFSDESDDEAAKARSSGMATRSQCKPTPAAASSTAHASRDSGPPAASFEQRSKHLSRGNGDHKWESVEQPPFHVRGKNYLQDKRKQPAAGVMLDFVSLDFVCISPSGPIGHAARHPDLAAAALRRKGDKRFLFIMNWILPPYQAFITAAVCEDAPWLANGKEGSPQARLWHRFLSQSSEGMRDRMKIVMSVAEGPWIVRRAVPSKPALVGRQLKGHVHQETDYLELVFDVSSGKTEQLATGLVMRALKKLDITMCLMVEGREADELPEMPLFCCSVKHVDTSALFCPLELDG